MLSTLHRAVPRAATFLGASAMARTASSPAVFRPAAVTLARAPVTHQHRWNATATSSKGDVSVHPKILKNVEVAAGGSDAAKPAAEAVDYLLRHPIYTKEELTAVEVTHKKIGGVRDAIAYACVRTMRFAFDSATNYSDKVGVMTERQWLNRICFLETVAGVPGMVAGMIRHMRSLRLLKRDHGWIITLLEEAENERMHLLTFMKMREAGPLFRIMVLIGQGVFFNAYFLAYLLSPITCHKFVGYLEESAVHTYTHCLKDIEAGQIKHWASLPAPEIAKSYWRLAEDATVKDVVAAVRADEADHRDTNNLLAGLKPDDPNPVHTSA
ncbi:inducible alternative oxidase 2 [Irineochytrium annulatum]|nr:inducible alternative oxidase 2 [Irineochytrium annulatum]